MIAALFWFRRRPGRQALAALLCFAAVLAWWLSHRLLQTYSALLGFFRQFTLISVVSEEQDVVRVRTNYRQGEDLYLYHTPATPQFAQSLFLNYIGLTNQPANNDPDFSARIRENRPGF